MNQIAFGQPMISEAEKQAVLEVMSGPILVHGQKMKDFEASFAAFTSAPHALALSSCTAGMHLFYHAMKLKAGDEVIVPAQTHTATAHSVEYCGATPVFVDAEIETGNIDIEQIEAKITSRTRVISLVHFLGLPVNMDKIVELARKHGLKILEDCALAVGSTLNGIHTGLQGDAGCFSFYPIKHMTTAEGGMLITKDAELADQISKYRAFGVDRQIGDRKTPGVYDVTMLGYNYRMNELQCAIGIEQIKRLPEFIKIRGENYHELYKGLEELDEIQLFRKAKGGEVNSFYCLSILLKDSISRIEFIKEMKEKGVGTSVYYPRPVPDLMYYKEKYGTQHFPVAERISNTSVALPVGPHLNRDDMQRIVDTVKECLRKSSV